jgi:hypothetical protein
MKNKKLNFNVFFKEDSDSLEDIIVSILVNFLKNKEEQGKDKIIDV